IISRNVRSIPYERIQDVNLEQGLLARMLGMARVRLETGSSGSGDEGVLDAVDLAEAGRLRDVIRLRKAAETASIAGDAPESAQAVADEATAPLFAMDSRRVLIAGVFNFSLVFLALVGAVINNLDFLFPSDWWEPKRLVQMLGLERLNALLMGLDWASRIIGVLIALFGLAVVGLVGGIIRTFLREHGFRLDRTASGLRRRRGALTLTDVVMPLHRIQAAVIATGPIRRKFGWFHLKVQSLASDNDKESDHSIAPLASRAEVNAILAETRIRWAMDEADMHRVDPAMWWVSMVLLLPIPIIGIAIGMALASPWLALVYLVLPILPLGGWANWRAHRFALVNDQLYVRTGFWTQALTILPLRRVQSVDIKQNAIDRFIGLASVNIGVAGRSGALTIDALPVAVAIDLRTALLEREW
uniref:PH domain-containing protein n=1 Tax=Blastomonas sp. TaxID=1909299 RepID=UPI003593D604